MQQAPGQALTVSYSGAFANRGRKSRRRFNPWTSAQGFNAAGTPRLQAFHRPHRPHRPTTCRPPSSLLPHSAPRGKKERTGPWPCPAAAILDRAERALLQSSAKNSHKIPKPYLPPKPRSKRMPRSTQTKTEAGNGVPVGVSGKCSLGYNLVA